MEPSAILTPIVTLILAQLVAGIFGWVIGWFTSEAEHRAEQDSPFFAGLMAFLKGVGIDIPKVLGGLLDMLLAMVNQHPAQKSAARRAEVKRGERGAAWPEAVFVTFAFAVMSVLLALGCAALKPACQGIDLLDKGCDLIPVTYLDDAGVRQQELIPRSDLRATAEYHRLARVHETGAGGGKPAGAP